MSFDLVHQVGCEKVKAKFWWRGKKRVYHSAFHIFVVLLSRAITASRTVSLFEKKGEKAIHYQY